MQDSGINVFFQGINSLLLLKGLWTTLLISLLSAGLSIPLGILLRIFMTLKNPIARVVSQIYLEIVRIMPQLVLLFVVYFGFTRAFGWNLSAYWSAIIVFTFWGTGEMGDLVRGALISIPKTQYESAQVLGLSKLQTMRLVVLPQAVRQLIPPSINLITRMIKTTSLVVLIGIVEVLKTGQQIIDANRFEYPTAALWVYGAVFLLYFLACWPVSLAAKALEKKWKA